MLTSKASICMKLNKWSQLECELNENMVINKYFSMIFQVPLLAEVYGNKNGKNSVIEDVTDIKEIKKIFRTKNNVLVLFTSSPKESQNAIKVFREASNLIKGQGTTILVDCTHR